MNSLFFCYLWINPCSAILLDGSQPGCGALWVCQPQGCGMPRSQPDEQSLCSHSGCSGGVGVQESQHAPSAGPLLQPPAAWRAQHWPSSRTQGRSEEGWRGPWLGGKGQLAEAALSCGKWEDGEGWRCWSSGGMEEQQNMNLSWCNTGMSLAELSVSPTATEHHSKYKNSFLYWCLLSLFPSSYESAAWLGYCCVWSIFSVGGVHCMKVDKLLWCDVPLDSQFCARGAAWWLSYSDWQSLAGHL